MIFTGSQKGDKQKLQTWVQSNLVNEILQKDFKNKSDAQQLEKSTLIFIYNNNEMLKIVQTIK